MNNFLYAARPILLDSLGMIFFAALLAMGVTPATAAVVGLAITAGHILILKLRRRPVAALQWTVLVLVGVAAAATFITNDPRFVMLKPTIVYFLVGLVLLKRGWMLRYMPPAVVARVEDVATAFGFVWAGLMFVTAGANLAFVLAAPAWWPAFVAIFPFGSKILLFGVQYTVTRAISIARVAAAARVDSAAEPT